MYKPTNIVRFMTPEGRELTGTIRLMGSTLALICIKEPMPIDILVDIKQIVGRVTTS